MSNTALTMAGVNSFDPRPSSFIEHVDDVELRLDAGGKAIYVRSASRVGKSDLGVNRKRVERLRELLKTRGIGA